MTRIKYNKKNPPNLPDVQNAMDLRNQKAIESLHERRKES